MTEEELDKILQQQQKTIQENNRRLAQSWATPLTLNVNKPFEEVGAQKPEVIRQQQQAGKQPTLTEKEKKQILHCCKLQQQQKAIEEDNRRLAHIGGISAGPPLNVNTPVRKPLVSKNNSGSVEMQDYVDKVTQLWDKYARQLQRFIQGTEKAGKHNPSLNKQVVFCKRVLNLLQNPQLRYPMSTLRCYEKILQKLFGPQNAMSPLKSSDEPAETKRRRIPEFGRVPTARGTATVQRNTAQGDKQPAPRHPTTATAASGSGHSSSHRRLSHEPLSHGRLPHDRRLSHGRLPHDRRLSHGGLSHGRESGRTEASDRFTASLQSGLAVNRRLSHHHATSTSTHSGKEDNKSVRKTAGENTMTGLSSSEQTNASDWFEGGDTDYYLQSSLQSSAKALEETISKLRNRNATSTSEKRSNPVKVNDDGNRQGSDVIKMMRKSRKRMFGRENTSAANEPILDEHSAVKRPKVCSNNDSQGMNPKENKSGLDSNVSAPKLSAKSFYGRSEKRLPSATVSSVCSEQPRKTPRDSISASSGSESDSERKKALKQNVNLLKKKIFETDMEIEKSKHGMAEFDENTLERKKRKLLENVTVAKKCGIKLPKNYTGSLYPPNLKSPANPETASVDKTGDFVVKVSRVSASPGSTTQSRQSTCGKSGAAAPGGAGPSRTSEISNISRTGEISDISRTGEISAHQKEKKKKSEHQTSSFPVPDVQLSQRAEASRAMLQHMVDRMNNAMGKSSSTKQSADSHPANSTGVDAILKQVKHDAESQLQNLRNRTYDAAGKSPSTKQSAKFLSPNSTDVESRLQQSLSELESQHQRNRTYDATRKSPSTKHSATFLSPNSTESGSRLQQSINEMVSQIQRNRTYDAARKSPSTKHSANTGSASSSTPVAGRTDAKTAAKSATKSATRSSSEDVTNHAHTPTLRLRTGSSQPASVNVPPHAIKSPTLQVKGKAPEFRSPTIQVNSKTNPLSVPKAGVSPSVKVPVGSASVSPKLGKTPTSSVTPSSAGKAASSVSVNSLGIKHGDVGDKILQRYRNIANTAQSKNKEFAASSGKTQTHDFPRKKSTEGEGRDSSATKFDKYYKNLSELKASNENSSTKVSADHSSTSATKSGKETPVSSSHVSSRYGPSSTATPHNRSPHLSATAGRFRSSTAPNPATVKSPSSLSKGVSGSASPLSSGWRTTPSASTSRPPPSRASASSTTSPASSVAAPTTPRQQPSRLGVSSDTHAKPSASAYTPSKQHPLRLGVPSANPSSSSVPSDTPSRIPPPRLCVPSAKPSSTNVPVATPSRTPHLRLGVSLANPSSCSGSSYTPSRIQHLGLNVSSDTSSITPRLRLGGVSSVNQSSSIFPTATPSRTPSLRLTSGTPSRQPSSASSATSSSLQTSSVTSVIPPRQPSSCVSSATPSRLLPPASNSTSTFSSSSSPASTSTPTRARVPCVPSSPPPSCSSSSSSSSASASVAVSTSNAPDVGSAISGSNPTASSSGISSSPSPSVVKAASKPPDVEAASSGSNLAGSDSDSECIVCFERPVNTVIYSCGHMCLCFQCATVVKEQRKECPVCREPIKDIIKTYKT